MLIHDYHDVLEDRLDALVTWMIGAHDAMFEARAYVDTGPVQERGFAKQAGLGWTGKNTCLINPVLGSWLFLSVVLCNVDLTVDEPGLDRCGTCTLCLEACPTAAFVEPWVMDARRCIAYLTIESRSPAPPDLEPAIGSHVFGCDVCQEVCPWNDRAPVSPDPAWQPRAAFDHPALATLAALTPGQPGVRIRFWQPRFIQACPLPGRAPGSRNSFLARRSQLLPMSKPED